MGIEAPERLLLQRAKLDQVRCGQIPLPGTVDLELTWRCNHKCTWCVCRDSHRTSDIRPELVTLVADYCHRHGVNWVILSGGGEPTLHPEFVPLTNYLAMHEVRIAVFTNGSTLPQLADHLVRTAAYIRVSLDAATRDTYAAVHGTAPSAFDTLLEAIAGLATRSSRPRLGLSFVRTQPNALEARQFVELADSLGVDELLIRDDVGSGLSACTCAPLELPPHRQSLVVNYRQGLSSIVVDQGGQCFAAALKMVVQPDGNVPFCCRVRDSAWRIGCLDSGHPASIEDTWGSPRHVDLWTKMDCATCGPCRFSLANRVIRSLLSDQGWYDIV